MNRCTRFAPFAVAAVATLMLAGCSKPPEPAPAVAAPAAPAATAANVSDVDVTEHVKTALSQSETLKGFEIGVVTLKGDVRLSGALGNQSQVDEAIRIARASDGAHAVHDELTIKP